jgi:serine/threonine-protein kinase
LTHPNTVQVFDYGQASDGTVFYAMEYLTGLSLDELVRRHGRLPPERVIFLLRQLCGALAEAHGVGLIHRDIKPSNVFVCTRGGLQDVAKLLDFGLVRMESTGPLGAGLTQAGLIFGTPAYMSPEQASGQRPVDARSDIYSLGALAYFLIASEPPFVRDSVAQTLAAHMDEPVTPLHRLNASVPLDFEEVVMRCLAKDPDDRFADAASVDRALGACRAAGEWTQAEASGWWSAVSIPVIAG